MDSLENRPVLRTQDRLVLRKKAEKRLPEQRGLLYDADKKINTDT